MHGHSERKFGHTARLLIRNALFTEFEYGNYFYQVPMNKSGLDAGTNCAESSCPYKVPVLVDCLLLSRSSNELTNKVTCATNGQVCDNFCHKWILSQTKVVICEQ